MADEQVDLTDYETKYLACRDLRHAWEARGYYRGAYGGVRRLLTCLRCGTYREDRWEGGEVKRAYDYPEGYQLDHKVDGAEVRDAVVKRAKVYATQDTMLKALMGGKRGSTGKVIDLRDSRRSVPDTTRQRAAVSR